MGLAWVSDDANFDAPSEPAPLRAAPESGPGPRHRRPTLLARGGQAMVGRITALAGTHPAAGPPRGRATGAQRPPARRTWS